jgi:RecB family endonuclease NucS
MLFKETVAVCSENHTEHTNTFRGQNTKIIIIKAGGMYDNHASKG